MYKIEPFKIFLRNSIAIFRLCFIVILLSYSNFSFGLANDLVCVDIESNTWNLNKNKEVLINITDQALTTEQLNISIMEPKSTQLFPVEIGPFLLKDNGKTRYYVDNGMMRERPHDCGDCLWRTSIAYITYKDEVLKDGMVNCTKWISSKHVQYYRSVEQNDNDVSRDQVTMFLVAMALNGEDVKKYIKATKWKLSKRFSLTIDMWLWMKALGGSKFAQKMFFVTQIPIAKVYQLWNKSGLSKKKFPAYASHLLAWQIYVLNDKTKYQKSLAEIVSKLADHDNYLVRLLLDLPVSQEQVENVKPTTDFQWQRNKREKALYCRELTPEEAEYNTIDVDVLKRVFSESCYK